jgi:hypothetical protein
MSAAVIEAVNWVVLTKVVVRSPPFQRTTEALMNPVPLTVRVKAAEPASALVGEREVTAGAGLLTVNPDASVAVPPPGVGLVTVTSRVPVAAAAAMVMLAVIEVLPVTFVVFTVIFGPKLTVVTPLM